MNHNKVNHSKHSMHQTSHHGNHRGLRGHFMENKNLVAAIVIVFVIIVAVGAVLIFKGGEDEPEGAEQVSLLAQTCEEWCNEERLSSWCDFGLSASNTVSGTCNAFSKSTIYASYGVSGCPAIDCENRPALQTEFTCSELGGVWEAPTTGGKCEQKGLSERFVQEDVTESSPIAGQICCTKPEFFG